MSKIVVEKTWTINHSDYRDGLCVCKSYLVSDLTEKKIPNSYVYSVDDIAGECNLNCFKTFKEAKAYIKTL